jgi:hypothetical protein
MRGEIIGVWSETWREIWLKLVEHPEYGNDLFSDLYREIVPAPIPPQEPPPAKELTAEGDLVCPEDIEARNTYNSASQTYTQNRIQYEEAISGGHLSRRVFRSVMKEQISSEVDSVNIFEKAYNVVSSYGDEAFCNRYFLLVEKFLIRYSLRYDLRRPFRLHPTLPGIFARLIYELKEATAQDAALNSVMHEFEEAIRDLRTDQSSGKIKTCIQKQMNLLEAIGQECPGVTGNTLGQICNQVGTWPHDAVKDSMTNLYRFSCDYPGIRHGGTAANQLRGIEMRDMVAVSVVLAGFSPYLTDLINSDSLYYGS